MGSRSPSVTNYVTFFECLGGPSDGRSFYFLFF
jgi:hypothetical protein